MTEPKLARDLAPPQAEGSLEATPFVYILVFLLGRSLSGRLTLRDPSGATVLVYLREGAPVAIEMSAPFALLGEQLVATGFLPAAALPDTIAEAASADQRLGEHLVDGGRIGSEDLTRLLEGQIEARCRRLATMPPETTFAFHTLVLPPAPRFEPWDPLNVLLATVRAWPDRSRIHATVRWLSGRPLALHRAADLSTLRLTQTESAALATLRSDTPTLEELYAAHGEGLSSLLYTLAVARQFAFSSEKGPPMGLAPGKRASQPPAVSRKSGPLPMPSSAPGPMPEPALTTPALVPEEDMPEPVDVEQPALPPAPPRTFHPPPIRIAAPPPRQSIAPAPGESAATIAPTGVSQSIPFVDHGRDHRGSTPPAGRPLPPPPPLAASRPPLIPPPPPSRPSVVPAPRNPTPPPAMRNPTPLPAPRNPTPAPRAAPSRAGTPQEQFQLAEEALQRGDLAAAETHALMATKGNASAEYASLYVWVRAQAGVELPESVRAFSRILEDSPECEPALYYRGMLLKQAGKDRAALRDFVAVVRLNPDHPGALAEVKLLRARGPK